jgi:hypothetical protein
LALTLTVIVEPGAIAAGASTPSVSVRLLVNVPAIAVVIEQVIETT